MMILKEKNGKHLPASWVAGMLVCCLWQLPKALQILCLAAMPAQSGQATLNPECLSVSCPHGNSGCRSFGVGPSLRCCVLPQAWLFPESTGGLHRQQTLHPSEFFCDKLSGIEERRSQRLCSAFEHSVPLSLHPPTPLFCKGIGMTWGNPGLCMSRDVSSCPDA